MEAVKLFVVRKNLSPDEDAIRTYSRQCLAAYKIPKHIEFIRELPKSTVGKILRRKLRNP